MNWVIMFYFMKYPLITSDVICRVFTSKENTRMMLSIFIFRAHVNQHVSRKYQTYLIILPYDKSWLRQPV